MEAVRIDKWLWAARFFKTRSAATDAVAGGRVQVNDQSVKPSRDIHVDDTVVVRVGLQQFTVVVTGIADKRGSATVAATLYAETSESAEERGRLNEQRRLSRPLGADLGPARPSRTAAASRRSAARSVAARRPSGRPDLPRPNDSRLPWSAGEGQICSTFRPRGGSRARSCSARRLRQGLAEGREDGAQGALPFRRCGLCHADRRGALPRHPRARTHRPEPCPAGPGGAARHRARPRVAAEVADRRPRADPLHDAAGERRLPRPAPHPVEPHRRRGRRRRRLPLLPRLGPRVPPARERVAAERARQRQARRRGARARGLARRARRSTTGPGSTSSTSRTRTRRGRPAWRRP